MKEESEKRKIEKEEKPLINRLGYPIRDMTVSTEDIIDKLNEVIDWINENGRR